MVDLVKLRKKAKKAVGGGAADSVGHDAPSAEVATQVPSEVERPEEGVYTAPAVPALWEPSASADVSPAPYRPARPDSFSKLERFKEEAGRLREITRVQDETPEQQGDQLEVLTFTIAAENYALEIEHIVEIVTPRGLTRVPNADPSIVGIMSLRGTIVTLLDIRTRLHQPEVARTPETRVVVLEHENQHLGFEVDSVLRVAKVNGAELEAHPVIHASEADDSIRGVFRHNGALTILLDLDKLLSGGKDAQPGTKERPAATA
jgi:purine-binding chemotaxis protein CheW